MSDFLVTLLLLIGVGLLFLFPAAYFGNQTGAILTALVLTGVGCFLLVYLEALGRAFGNGNSAIRLSKDLIIPFTGLAALFGFMAYGSYCLGQVIKGIEGYQLKSVIWSAMLVGFPLYLYGSSVFGDYYTKRKHYQTQITLAHPKDFPVLIDRIKFFNSKTKKASLFYFRHNENHQKGAEIEGLSEQNHSKQMNRYYTKLPHTLIPIGFDSFELSWYSVDENKFYRDVFPIDQKKLNIRENYQKQLIISDLLICILPHGNVDLSILGPNDSQHITHYFDIASHDVKGQTLNEIFQSHSQISPLGLKELNLLKADFEQLKKGTVKGLSPEEILSFRKVFTFGMDIHTNQKPNDIREIEIIDFYLNRYSRTVDFLKEINTKPLPRLIKIGKLNDQNVSSSLDVLFDKKTLYHQYTSFIEYHHQNVRMELELNETDLTKSQIWLKSNDERIALENWTITE